jgi:hypothetical protein
MRVRNTTGVAAAALTAIALIMVVTLVWSRPGNRPTHREPGPGPAAGAAATATPRAEDRSVVARSGARLRAEDPGAVARPVRLIMPATDIAAPLRPVGVTGDGQMELPANPRVMGWYRFGAVPGERGVGSVVLAGHLDSKRFGLGPLVRLRDVRLGDPVQVALGDGTRRDYRVTGLERFDRQALPAFVFSRSGPERLRVITCGGEYDADAGGYQQNLVVTAVSDPNPPPPSR